MVLEGEWRMESIQEKFAEQRAGERLKREQNVVEKERAKHQKKMYPSILA